VLIFMAEVCLFLDQAIVTDILLYVTVPTRRSPEAHGKGCKRTP
jgi:hypothetical protein